MHFLKISLFTLLMAFVGTSLILADECRLMRFPDIHQNKIVFTYAGDLWLVSSQGGVARQLTSHPGEETFAKFSPDGTYIAFTGKYEGDLNVYLIPAEGGEPRQLTHHPSGDRVIDWYPTGNKILFRSARESHRASARKLFSIDIKGGFPKALVLPESGLAAFSPDGKKLALNRRFRETRTWKRYKGGTAQDIWIYDLKANAIERITDWEGTDNSPMWSDDKIYFNSDREHTLNIYSYDLRTKKIKKITNHEDYDVKWPSLGPGSIVYENGGYLYVLDLATEETKRISVEVRSDLILTRPSYENVSDLIREFGLSPSAKRALFEARGDIFAVPEKKGDTRNITRTPAIREIYPAWSPDGKWVAYLSDKTGEYEIYIRPQDGTGEEIRITNDGDCYRFRLFWSPDNKKILYTDKRLRLFYVDIEDKKPILVAQSDVGEIRHYSWSPDSKWIAYTKNASHFFESIYLYSLEQEKTHKITDDFNDDINPVFDPEGKYLYFLSGRSFSPTFSDFERQYIYRNSRNIYLVTLQADSLSPFAPESDEEEIEEEGEEEAEKEGEDEEKEDENGEKDKDEKEEKAKDIVIDLAGIDKRIVGVPIPSGNYSRLTVQKEKIFYLAAPAIRGKNGGENGQNELHMYDIKEREDHTLLAGISNYDISDDGEKIIYAAGKTYGIIEAKGKENKVGDGKLDLSGMEMKVEPKGEWEQMFNEAWRLQRDFFYDPNMHGVDWELMKKRYGQLLPYVAHRSDLSYIIGEMIGELCASHTYIWGGKKPQVKSLGVGLLGADFELDPDSDMYRFKKIYKGENWKKNRRAPLTEPGATVKEGDYLIAVNGKEVKYPADLLGFFEKTAGKQVKIKINSEPSTEGARECTVRPVSSDSELRYLDWVEINRKKVEKATDGKVGYIHVPNTATTGINEFSRAFFAQVNKEGLVVDVRFNGGGWDPSMILDRLQRKVTSLWSRREGQLVHTPHVAFRGHTVCVINEYAGSGGDAFPFYFKELGLGPLIGTRTWGGLIGFSRLIPLMDGGSMTMPEIAFMNLKGEWDVENYGVDPDIEIDNRPDLVVAGRDPQLEKAIEVVMKKIKEEPVELPPRPPYPVKK